MVIKIFSFRYNCIILLLGIALNALSQNTQRITGVVIDNDTKNPISAGVKISLGDTSLNLSTTADDKGRFELNNVPIGRHVLDVKCEQYQPYTTSVLIISGNSFYIEVNLLPKINSIMQLKEIVVSNFSKSKPINTMAVTGVRSFSTEETERYAGSFGDPARMVQNYAGVAAVGDGRNDIVIRGNNSYGVLWRIDNVDVANPNHFGSKGSTGGPISILNNNFLTNSDFFMSAFPAEYGNAFSGVFDLKMKEGDYSRYHGIVLVGWNGAGIGATGPIQKEKSSFIVGYRYANLAIFKLLNINLGFDGIPQYQDLTLKTNFRTKKAGDFSFVFIGGLSSIQAPRSDNITSAYNTLFNINNNSNKLITFLNHKITIDNQSNLKSFISMSIDQTNIGLDSPNYPKKYIYAVLNETDIIFSLGTTYRRRLSEKNILETGLRTFLTLTRYADSQALNNHTIPVYATSIVNQNNLWQSYVFVQWKHDFTYNLFSTLGVNYNYLFFNNTWSLDPRAGLNYIIGQHTLGFGYGLVSKPLPYIIYFQKDSVTGRYTNHNLGFYKSHQLSLSDNWSITNNFRIKAEVYYQYIFNVPITKTPSSYSMINFGASYFQERPDNLKSAGIGQNYGVELTIEKFLSKNWYLLSTLSLFQSKYLASDNIWRSTQFNNNYICHLLGGYEIKTSKNTMLQLNADCIVAGGSPLESYNIDGTINDKLEFTQRANIYFRLDARVAFTINTKKGMSHEISLDFLNLTNHRNEYLRIFNPKTKGQQITYQTGFLPMISYRFTL